MLADIRLVCEQRQIALKVVTKLIGLNELQPSPARGMPVWTGTVPAHVVARPAGRRFPGAFWQQRIGQHGRSFLVHKFRTCERHSIGRLSRPPRIKGCLFNVLVGDMSLIGPRSLLPQDQPTNAGLRLSVRPGITGWAQVHGGNLVTPEEKGALDEWYVHHASLWLDLRVLVFTLGFLITGERRSEEAVRTARFIQQNDYQRQNLALGTAKSDSDVVSHSQSFALRVRARVSK